MKVYVLILYEDSSYVERGLGMLVGVYATRAVAVERLGRLLVRNRFSTYTGEPADDRFIVESDDRPTPVVPTSVIGGAVLGNGHVYLIRELDIMGS